MEMRRSTTPRRDRSASPDPRRSMDREDSSARESRSRARSPPPVGKPRSAPNNPEPTRIVGVFGLSVRTVEQNLEEEFSKVAPVEKVVIVYDARTQRSRGFGFVTMQDLDGAAEVIKQLNGIVRITVRRKVPIKDCGLTLFAPSPAARIFMDASCVSIIQSRTSLMIPRQANIVARFVAMSVARPLRADTVLPRLAVDGDRRRRCEVATTRRHQAMARHRRAATAHHRHGDTAIRTIILRRRQTATVVEAAAIAVIVADQPTMRHRGAAVTGP